MSITKWSDFVTRVYDCYGNESLNKDILKNNNKHKQFKTLMKEYESCYNKERKDIEYQVYGNGFNILSNDSFIDFLRKREDYVSIPFLYDEQNFFHTVKPPFNMWEELINEYFLYKSTITYIVKSVVIESIVDFIKKNKDTKDYLKNNEINCVCCLKTIYESDEIDVFKVINKNEDNMFCLCEHDIISNNVDANVNLVFNAIKINEKVCYITDVIQ